MLCFKYIELNVVWESVWTCVRNLIGVSVIHLSSGASLRGSSDGGKMSCCHHSRVWLKYVSTLKVVAVPRTGLLSDCLKGNETTRRDALRQNAVVCLVERFELSSSSFVFNALAPIYLFLCLPLIST